MLKKISLYVFSLALLMIAFSASSESFHIETMEDLRDAICDESIDSFEVSKSNPFFSTKDGVLFSKDYSMLIAYPVGRKDWIYAVPATVKEIGEDSFAFAAYLKELFIPDSVEVIHIAAFYDAKIERIVLLGNTNVHIDAISNLPNLQELVLCRGNNLDKTLKDHIHYIVLTDYIRYADD